METIKLHFPFNRDSFIEEQMFRYTLMNKSYKKQWVQLLVSVPILFAIAAYNQGKPAIFNGFSALTTLAFIFGFWLYAASKIKEKDYKKIILKYADRYTEQQLECDYEFSDEELKYWDSEKHMYFKWHCLTRFSYEEDYIVIWYESNPYFLLNRKELLPTVISQLEKLLHEKIPFSESKISSSKKKNSDELIDQ